MMFTGSQGSTSSMSTRKGVCTAFSTNKQLKDAITECMKPRFMSDPTCSSSGHGPISGWDVSRVTDMSGIFHGHKTFNADISKWDVRNAITMASMFEGAAAFNGDISNWDVSSCTDMEAMFSGASQFNGDLSRWRTLHVASMKAM